MDYHPPRLHGNRVCPGVVLFANVMSFVLRALATAIAEKPRLIRKSHVAAMKTEILDQGAVVRRVIDSEVGML